MVNAQIRVGQDLLKPKAIHVFKDGDWHEKRMGYVFKNGEWVPFIKYEEYLYNRGQEILIFNRTNAAGTFTKEVDHYKFGVSSTDRSVTVPVLSNEPVDLSTFNKLTLVHEPTYFHGTPSLTLFTAMSRTHTNPIAESVTHFRDVELGDLNIIEVDVSSLSGLYYIGFILKSSTGSNSGDTKVYQVYLE